MYVEKIRVYELARELEMKSKHLVEFLQELGADVKNHMSNVDGEIATLVRDHYTKDAKAKAEAKNEQQTKAKSPAAAQPKQAEKTKQVEEPKPMETNKQTRSTRQRSSRPRQRPRGRGRRTRQPVQKPRPTKVEIPESITVKDLAGRMSVPAVNIIKKLMEMGILATIPQSIGWEEAAMVAEDFGFSVKLPEIEIIDPLADFEDPPEKLEARPPIVTIMGHVDHGKTTLLDAIRESKVVEGEAGGITQHIGAYQAECHERKITFLDTPGHEAFTAMRSRGAQVTDIAVLVVAADDGVMPQTREAVSHAQAADVPIIVAVNKIDRADANPERIKQGLSELGLIPEDWGGETVFVNLSALRREGIDELLEMILLVADLYEFQANPDRLARGTIVEAQLDRGRGPVATVLVQNGTLKVGDPIVAGVVSGRVRAMSDASGHRVETAGPAMPVEVVGFSDVPEAGDELVALDTERLAREIADEKQEAKRTMTLRPSKPVSLDDLFERIKEGEVKELNIIIKADVQGSVEAVRQALEGLGTDEVRVNVIHGAAGGITETDVNLAAASNAVVVGFNVRPDATARRVAELENVDVRTYRVIYHAIEDVKSAMEGLLDPDYIEEVVGRAQVRATFRVPNAGVVAGSYVLEGKITRNSHVRLLRDNVVMHEGPISSLKRFKDDVREVNQGYECGIGIERFNDVKEGDELEAYVVKAVKRTL